MNKILQFPGAAESDGDASLRDLLNIPKSMSVSEYLETFGPDDDPDEFFGTRPNPEKVQQYQKLCEALKPMKQERTPFDGIFSDQEYASMHVDLHGPSMLTKEQRSALLDADGLADAVYVGIISGDSGKVRITFTVDDVWLDGWPDDEK